MDVKEENKTITIGGENVSPGESKLLKITIDRLPTGTLIDIPVYVFNSKKPGPTLLVQAGLHGDEINGIEIVRRMLAEKRFNVVKGAVIAVPILNIFGFIHYSRDVPDGKDVNRSFPGTKTGSMASRIAYHYVAEVMHQIDFGIDLHTGGGQRHNFPQIRYTAEDAQSAELAEIFNAPISFSSKLIKGSFRNATYRSNKPTIVFEAGESMRFDEYSILEGIQGVLNVMKHMEMILSVEPAKVERNKTIHLTNRKWLRAPTAGMFIPKITNGSEIRKGQVLGIVTDTFAKRTKQIKAPFNGFICCVNHQAVVNQGEALFHVGMASL
ncbi:succinylglutamate desuccinylase/aspartoacylase family protein [Aurantibacter crassamenti]|uniref:succinylglutamate desuccinylase/aspartoacylase family protein n=1 Tax=Aurantibacter crassamenti TaxID=1837375 RepID=UPI001939FFF1|nr:succinylglutamate desuccinylase/aspartoacylase family protein [Aurantibacter crassamenti]MBM1105322.1 succinylglutamate desuccinylase/aspartoacylase family protein [Aurantibacter crassamenti]